MASAKGSISHGKRVGKILPAVRRHRMVSLWQNAWRRLLKNTLAVCGGSAVLFLTLVAVFADFVAPYHYTEVNFGRNYEFPSREFLFGTDILDVTCSAG